MNTYFRITAYYPKENISATLDANGKYEELWEFSAFLVSKGFKILEVCESEQIAEATFPLINIKSSKILLRSVEKGIAEIQHFEHQGRKCKSITVGDKTYGIFE